MENPHRSKSYYRTAQLIEGEINALRTLFSERDRIDVQKLEGMSYFPIYSITLLEHQPRLISAQRLHSLWAIEANVHMRRTTPERGLTESQLLTD